MSDIEFYDDPIATPFREPDRDDTWQDFVDDWRDSQQARLARMADDGTPKDEGPTGIAAFRSARMA